MAYIPHFEYDIFISYAHVNNLGSGWVDRFHEALEIALAQRVGRVGEVKIWRDNRKLDGGQLFDLTIETAVRKAALFLALASNGYLKSDYCLQELSCFQRKASSEPFGLQIEDRLRIWHCLLHPVSRERWPSEFGRKTGFNFFATEGQSVGAEEEFSEPTDPELDKAVFKRQITLLANALFDGLEEFRAKAQQLARDSSAAAPPVPVRSASQGGRIFVADVADPLVSIRKRLVNELKGKGFAVETAVPPPYDAESHAARVQEATEDALLSIHLLDEVAGREIDGEPGYSYPRKQVDLANGRSKAQFIWVQKELDSARIEDDGYRDWLDQLEKGQRGGSPYDFVRGSSGLLVPQVLDRIGQLEKAASTPESPDQSVLIDTHFKDQIYALELGKLLLEQSVQPYINPQEDDPNKNLDAFEARLRSVTSVVIFYGNVSEDWVRHRLAAALQLSVIKNLPIKAFYVLLMPPERPEKNTDFQLGPVAVRRIDNSRSTHFDRAAMAPLFGGMA